MTLSISYLINEPDTCFEIGSEEFQLMLFGEYRTDQNHSSVCLLTFCLQQNQCIN